MRKHAGSPLNGIRVLDLTRLLPGAAATEMLADAGAEVIKIEQPGTGDYARASYTSLFELTNQGKKSVEIDLKQSPASFLNLVKTADVLIEGFRPGVMDRLGLGYEILCQSNPRLIYAALTGYGSQGEHALLAGHDVNYLAMSGVLDLIRDDAGMPVIPGVQIADLAGGSMQAVIGILLALEQRRHTGAGQRIDVSMTGGLDVLLPVARSQGPVALLSGRYACYRVYPAAEKSYVAVGALEPKFFRNLCRELGCEDLIARQFAEDQALLMARFEQAFAAATAEQWFVRIGTKDCCVTPVRAAAPAAVLSGRAPLLGEHNGEFL